MKTQIFGLLLLSFLGMQKISAQITWEQKANKPTKNMCNGVSFKGKIYVSHTNATGNICIEEYDPVNNIWTVKKGMSHSTNGGVYCFVATTSGMYILGGYSGNKQSNKVEEYNPILDTFLVKKDMPVAIDCSTASSVNGKIYVIGGVLQNTSVGSNKTYEYDPTTETWTTKKNAPRPRSEHYSLTIDDKIYTWGGFTANGYANYVDIYDPATDTWSAGTQNIESGKWGYGLGYAKGALYFMLGTTEQVGGGPSLLKEEIYKYDLQTKTSTKVETKTNAIWFMATVSVNDSVYLIGGLKGLFPSGPLQNITEVFTPTSATGIGYLPVVSKKIPVSIRYNTLTRGIVVSCNEQRIQSAMITVVGIDGKTMYSNKHLDIFPKAEIPTDNFPTGIYIVSVRSDQTFATAKIMLN